MHDKSSDNASYFWYSERLGFRTWAKNDFKLAFELWGDPQVSRFIDARGTLSADQVREKLDKEITTEVGHNVQYWPIFLLQNNDHVGCCGLRPYDLENKVYEIGFHICPQFWRQGFALEAAHTVMQYAFTKLNACALFAGHNPANQASRLLLEKLHFRYTHDEFYPPTGLQHPSYLLRVDQYMIQASQ